jgi:O-antigen ligase
MIASGWSQHFGGLEETRKFFYLYQAPKMKEIPVELVKRMTSHRVFATMFYPNALAGALLLLLPGLLGFIGLSQRALTFGARAFVVGAIGIGALGCLFWSGSKGGWLLMLLLGLVALLRVPFARKYKIVLVSGVLVLGLAGFFVRYAVFFQKGATSVSARFDYWRAAVQITGENPMLGTGPGTFRIRYQEIKRPESELARLVHNDYLEQASDSGVPGFLVYAGFIGVCLVLGWRTAISTGWGEFWVWLGVLGWALQGFVEFGLYIPALAWPAFGLLGWLLRRGAGKSSTAEIPRDRLQPA